jgi:predicted RNA binding protein YcfA (HicA-like mRNA interferase family)
VKRADLERWLRSHGAEPVAGRSGGGHDAWQHSHTRAKSFVPRHREIGVGVVRAICRQLGVPPIPKR